MSVPAPETPPVRGVGGCAVIRSGAAARSRQGGTVYYYNGTTVLVTDLPSPTGQSGRVVRFPWRGKGGRRLLVSLLRGTRTCTIHRVHDADQCGLSADNCAMMAENVV
eukprot:gene11616-biopygen13945